MDLTKFALFRGESILKGTCHKQKPSSCGKLEVSPQLKRCLNVSQSSSRIEILPNNQEKCEATTNGVSWNNECVQNGAVFKIKHPKQLFVSVLSVFWDIHPISSEIGLFVPGPTR